MLRPSTQEIPMSIVIAFIAGAVTAVAVPKVYTFVAGVIAKIKALKAKA